MINIKKIRNQIGITQTEFAKALGVSRQSVNNWERGNFKPTPVAEKIIHDYCKEKNIKIE